MSQLPSGHLSKLPSVSCTNFSLEVARTYLFIYFINFNFPGNYPNCSRKLFELTLNVFRSELPLYVVRTASRSYTNFYTVWFSGSFSNFSFEFNKLLSNILPSENSPNFQWKLLKVPSGNFPNVLWKLSGLSFGSCPNFHLNVVRTSLRKLLKLLSGSFTNLLLESWPSLAKIVQTFFNKLCDLPSEGCPKLS